MKNFSSLIDKTPVRKLFWKYTIPTIMAMIANSLYVMVDGIFVGRFVGAEGLAAVNISFISFGLLLGTGALIGNGTCAIFSIEKGKQNYDNCKKSLFNGFIVAIILAIILSHVIKLFAHDLNLLQINDNANVINLGDTYINIFRKNSIFTILAVMTPMLIRNDEKPNLATALMIFTSIFNIGLDYIFVAKLGKGIEGAAIATIISQAIISIYGIIYFLSNQSSFKLTISNFILDYKYFFRIIKIGSSSFLMTLYWSIIGILYNKLFDRYGGTTYVAAYTIVNYVSGIYYFISEGTTNGVQPLFSYFYGSQKYFNIRRIDKQATKFLFILYTIYIILIEIFALDIALIFNKEDMALAKATAEGLRLFLIGIFLESYILLGIIYFQSVENCKRSATLSIVNMFVQIPFLFIMPKFFGIKGLWLVYGIANIGLALLIYKYKNLSLKQLTFSLRKKKK
ncbi:MAG: polysaccharide biosynthesis C-terminal domain-containing protein [Alphaproteobacteria bacterium]|nr:polysaccharide biosynthesis C-terminal domain-containing protein [Alphaproteobacteria bacterium]